MLGTFGLLMLTSLFVSNKIFSLFYKTDQLNEVNNRAYFKFQLIPLQTNMKHMFCIKHGKYLSNQTFRSASIISNKLDCLSLRDTTTRKLLQMGMLGTFDLQMLIYLLVSNKIISLFYKTAQLNEVIINDPTQNSNLSHHKLT